eukprot:CAMPEP_0114273964 /NCGR_PEP_ID=MMETSP0058-20121206/29466_1 /TAXON_ID=36894 /ORGANISM="Pyramimonas parkeae, CCMP726" /LENGTH=164 /DNA_ID=CAMNT_0001393631 /DNA_START=187 /DNA_END=681 /DNA_ORIENTATION=-
MKLFVAVLFLLVQPLIAKRATTKARPISFSSSEVEGVSENSGHGSVNQVVCNITGPCIPCQSHEKDEDWSVCRSTGHRQPITCLVLPQSPQAESDGPITRRHLASLPGRRLKFEEKRYNVESRAASGESLSIWTFELVVLVMLAASASLVYYRKLRGGPNGGGK